MLLRVFEASQKVCGEGNTILFPRIINTKSIKYESQKNYITGSHTGVKHHPVKKNQAFHSHHNNG